MNLAINGYSDVHFYYISIGFGLPLDRLVDSFEPGKVDSEITTKIDQLVLQGMDLLSSDIDSRFEVSDLGWYNFAQTLEDSLMAKVWLENFNDRQKNYFKDGVFMTFC